MLITAYFGALRESELLNPLCVGCAFARSSLELLREISGKDPFLCPICLRGRMLRNEVIESTA